MTRDAEHERDPSDEDVDGDETENGEAESTPESDIAEPGLGALQVALEKRGWPHLPGRAALRRDAVAGLSITAANVPDGMANALLVGVNPLLGLYATMVGPIVGGVLSSTRLNSRGIPYDGTGARRLDWNGA